MNRDQDAIIVGGGPAGVVLGLLLARQGARCTLLEMHKDFDRDFRGDTVHASTMEVLDQIGLADKVLALPHTKMREVRLTTEHDELSMVDFSRLRSRFPYVCVMPQAQFLEYLVEEAERYDNFTCIRSAPVRELLREDGRVVGVRYKHGEAERDLTAKIVVACDGRFSRMRKLAGLEAEVRAPPMDVCWLRFARHPEDGHETGAFYLRKGRMMVFLPRAEHWQIGYVFPKGDFKALREQGIERFRESIVEVVPWLEDRVDTLQEWDDVHLLNVKSDCLTRWWIPGLLLIGDAAHVMSPVGGVGINIAIGDAVATANALHGAFDGDGPDDEVLAGVQKQRALPTRITQNMQAAVQSNLVARALKNQAFDLPWPVKLLVRTPGLRALPLRIFALGVKRVRLANP